MHKILGVRFREVGKISYFIYEDNDKIKKNDMVIAQTKKGIECGTVVVICDNFPVGNITQPDEKIIRKAREDDLKSLSLKKQEEENASKICKEKILTQDLKMKLVDTEYLFDRSKIIFYFVSEARVDFRNLVKELARTFKTRIELRQIKIREEAKMLNGLGICGKSFCCSTFLNDFEPVSLKMAKNQGVNLSPSKLTGTCGRLMCCLKYENDIYVDMIRKMPEVGSTVLTPDGEGVVLEQNVILSKISVSLKNNDNNSEIVKKFDVKNICKINK